MAHLIVGNGDIVLPLCLVAVLLESTFVQQVFTECLLCVRCCALCPSESHGVANSPEMGGGAREEASVETGSKVT